MRAIFACLLPWLDTAGTWSALRLNFPMRHVSFVLYPFCPWSSPSNGLINQRARGVGDRPRERERRPSRLQPHDRIKYGCADSPRQEVAFPSENGLREVFWIQCGWSAEHPPFLSLFLRSFRHRSTIRRVHGRTAMHTRIKCFLKCFQRENTNSNTCNKCRVIN